MFAARARMPPKVVLAVLCIFGPAKRGSGGAVAAASTTASTTGSQRSIAMAAVTLFQRENHKKPAHMKTRQMLAFAARRKITSDHGIAALLRFPMILTKCASCAAPLPHLAKQCSRCKTRYCSAPCQKKHWEEGGHDKLCKKIRKGGGAEQYNANKKYAEATTVAAEACTVDTKGQTCYICTQALHWKTKEGLVRGCACRGTAGFAHVSCLAEQAKILMDEAEENNLGAKVLTARFRRWEMCSLCEQDYHGVVRCALGWACWKTYVGRPEGNQVRQLAMEMLGNGLFNAGFHADELLVREADLSVRLRLGVAEDHILSAQGNLADVYGKLGRREQCLSMRRDVYLKTLKLHGEEHGDTLRAADNYAIDLYDLRRFKEAKALLLKTIPVARRVFGDSDEITLRIRSIYAGALYMDDGGTLDDLREAVATLEDTARTAQRVFGGSHPRVAAIGKHLQEARKVLCAHETPSP